MVVHFQYYCLTDLRSLVFLFSFYTAFDSVGFVFYKNMTVDIENINELFLEKNRLSMKYKQSNKNEGFNNFMKNWEKKRIIYYFLCVFYLPKRIRKNKILGKKQKLIVIQNNDVPFVICFLFCTEKTENIFGATRKIVLVF